MPLVYICSIYKSLVWRQEFNAEKIINYECILPANSCNIFYAYTLIWGYNSILHPFHTHICKHVHIVTHQETDSGLSHRQSSGTKPHSSEFIQYYLSSICFSHCPVSFQALFPRYRERSFLLSITSLLDVLLKVSPEFLPYYIVCLIVYSCLCHSFIQ